MATDLPGASAAGITWHGVTFRPLTLDDLAAFDLWIQDRSRDANFAWLEKTVAERAAAGRPMAPSAIQSYREAILTTAGRLGWNTPEGKREANNHAGALKLLELTSGGAANRAWFESLLEAPGQSIAELQSAVAEAVQKMASKVVALSEDPDAVAEEPGAEPDPTRPDPTSARSTEPSPSDMDGRPPRSGN